MGLTFTQPEPSLVKAYKEWVAEVKLAASEAPAGAGAAAEATQDTASGGAPAGTPAAGAAAPSGTPAAKAAPAPPAPAAPEPKGPVRRQLESPQGQVYDVVLERRRGAWQMTITQLPRQAGVSAADQEGSYPDYASAEKALREFVRSR